MTSAHSRLLTYNDILAISCYIPMDKLFRFATDYLKMTASQYENSVDKPLISVYEIAYKCIKAWRDSRVPEYSAKDLQEILRKAWTDGLAISLKRIEILDNKKKLTSSDISHISIAFNNDTWDAFVKCYLDFDTTPVMTMMPVSHYFDPATHARKVLVVWTNNNPGTKVCDLKNAFSLAINDGLFSQDILDKFHGIIK